VKGTAVKFDPPAAAFESIESAKEYLGLLAQVIEESQQSVQADIQTTVDANHPRRLEALRLIGYNLEKLATHIKVSHRILNDLRMLRRILQQGDGRNE
jgi:hypothetical protein